MNQSFFLKLLGSLIDDCLYHLSGISNSGSDLKWHYSMIAFFDFYRLEYV